MMLQATPILTALPAESTLTDLLVRKPSSSSKHGTHVFYFDRYAFFQLFAVSKFICYMCLDSVAIHVWAKACLV